MCLLAVPHTQDKIRNMALRAHWLLGAVVLLACTLGRIEAAEKKHNVHKAPEQHITEEQKKEAYYMMHHKREAYMAEKRKRDAAHHDDVSDWSIHTDVDDSVYWYSRLLMRSVKEPPKGWTKDEKTGKWKPPSWGKEEL